MERLEEGDPRQVGRFEIVARLGSGGMGRVYLAQLPDGQQFALKMIHQFLSDDVQFRRRFHREVLAAQRVTGAHTAALVDADPDARPPWMAVEYVDGPTLTELIEHGGPLTLASSVRLASGMARALISIHAAGLVHRDLKPSNVLMGADGARLIDFGIAQASGASSLTMTGLVTGSAGFMSPEQATAEHVTEASDVFALGTVLYFAATGRRPFGEGSIISVTYRVVHADPELSLIRDDGLRELIANCLMKDPRRRPTPQQVYERCPGIADGSWRVGRTGETLSTLTAGPVSEAATLQRPSVLLQSPTWSTPQPMVMPTRRDSRDADRRDDRGWLDTLRVFASRPVVAIPVISAVILGAGTAIALAVAAGPTTSPSTGSATATSAPAAAGGETPSNEPIGPVKPSIYTVPTRSDNTAFPTPRPTGTPTGRPTPTKPESTATTAPGEDPDPTQSSDPPVVVPPDPTTDAPSETTTPSPTDPPAGE